MSSNVEITGNVAFSKNKITAAICSYYGLQGTPSSRATTAAGLPLVCSIRIASRLNLALNL
jgi:hypothetical protein